MTKHIEAVNEHVDIWRDFRRANDELHRSRR